MMLLVQRTSSGKNYLVEFFEKFATTWLNRESLQNRLLRSVLLLVGLILRER